MIVGCYSVLCYIIRYYNPLETNGWILASRFNGAATMCECVHIMSDRNVKCLTGSDCQ